MRGESEPPGLSRWASRWVSRRSIGGDEPRRSLAMLSRIARPRVTFRLWHRHPAYPVQDSAKKIPDRIGVSPAFWVVRASRPPSGWYGRLARLLGGTGVSPAFWVVRAARPPSGWYGRLARLLGGTGVSPVGMQARRPYHPCWDPCGRDNNPVRVCAKKTPDRIGILPVTPHRHPAYPTGETPVPQYSSLDARTSADNSVESAARTRGFTLRSLRTAELYRTPRSSRSSR